MYYGIWYGAIAIAAALAFYCHPLLESEDRVAKWGAALLLGIIWPVPLFARIMRR